MPDPSPLEWDPECFAWRVWSDPGRVLERLEYSGVPSGPQRGVYFARRAAAWMGMLCLGEAERDAHDSLDAGTSQTPRSRVSALGAIADIAAFRHDPSHILLRREELRLIHDNDLSNTDVHVAALLNCAAFSQDPVEMTATLDLANKAWHATHYRNLRLRTSRGFFLRYLRSSAKLTNCEDIAALTDLLRLIDDAEAAGHLQICALGHMSLSEIYRQSDLYSASLLHASIASELWASLGRVERRAEVLLTQSKLLRSLGMTTQAEQVLGEIAGGVGSRAQFNESERLGCLSSLREYEGDRHGALDLALQSARATPELIAGDYISPIMNWVVAGIHARKLDDVVALEVAKRGLRHAIAKLVHHEAWTELAQALPAVLDGDIVEWNRITVGLIERWPQINGHNTRVAIETLRDLMLTPDVVDRPFRADLHEYWEHIVHLSGEDDEQVRAQFRLANCIPVLNRILSEGGDRLVPELQFELVELIRFGAVAALNATPKGGLEGRSALRILARQHLESTGLRFPAVYGEPRPLLLGARPTELAEVTDVSPLNVDLLVRPDELGEAPDLLQLYLRGTSLHWLYRSGRDMAVSGRTQLRAEVLRVIKAFQELMTPRLGPFEGRVGAIAGLAVPQLTAVAAARTASGPLVARPELAHDLLCYLPVPHRESVWRAIVAMEVPSYRQLADALGELIPDLVVGANPTGRPLLVSTDLELATLPIVLAYKPDWREPFVARRYPMVLPPLNLLAALPPVDVVDDMTPWSVVRIGNSLGDLSFAGEMSSPDAAGNALLIQDPKVASRRAVLYRGHLSEPPPGRPSEAGLYLGPNRILHASTLLEDPRPWRTPARLGLLACRAAGWDLGGEWGGIAAAAMLRGTHDVIAPLWPLIDAEPAEALDQRLTQVLGYSGALGMRLHEEVASLYQDWMSDPERAIPPHWWASLALMSR